MAESWIKVRTNLKDDPRVARLAVALSFEERCAVGALVLFWSWADAHATELDNDDGRIDETPDAVIDRIVMTPGFAQAMREVGWLVDGTDCLILPGYVRHNGTTGKTRANAARRMANNRAGVSRKRAKSVRKKLRGRSDGVAPTFDSRDAPSAPEKRREEERRQDDRQGSSSSPEVRSEHADAEHTAMLEAVRRFTGGRFNGAEEVAAIELARAVGDGVDVGRGRRVSGRRLVALAAEEACKSAETPRGVKGVRVYLERITDSCLRERRLPGEPAGGVNERAEESIDNLRGVVE
ncbi:MAG: hypothetical protein AAGI54_08225 [Planctomycetota bacterium]